MNYKDEILENKAFKFFKQLMYNIALAICIMLVGVLIMVYGFKFRLYEVLSDSQAPIFREHDLVVVKAQKEYKVGDIIKFDTTIPVTHRIIAIYDKGSELMFICHGDAVPSANPENGAKNAAWQDDAAYVQSLIDAGKDLTYIAENTQNEQIIKLSQVEGKVIAHLDNYGTKIKFVKDHYMLFIALVAGIWCISGVVQNELDLKKCRRLL